MNKIKINVCSAGRFHLLDLARELDANGFDVKFYSFITTKRAEKYGLPRGCNSSLLIQLFPFVILERILFKRSQWARRLRKLAQDLITGIFMRKCDVIIALSGNYVYTIRKAKRNGSIIILERGSKHILEQKKILEDINLNGNIDYVPENDVKREFIGYDIADYISIPSQHVKESFLKYDFPEDKIFINPYGVDIRMFRYIPDVAKKYDVIMVGTWCYRKGCDLLIEALSDTKITLLHVGAVGDLEFPDKNNFTHVDPVDQCELVNYYNLAKVFALVSREEGLAVVQGQAMACGMPIVCTNDTGGADLRDLLFDRKWVVVIPETNSTEILRGIKRCLELYEELTPGYNYIENAKDNITWDAYGKRYSNFIYDITRNKMSIKI